MTSHSPTRVSATFNDIDQLTVAMHDWDANFIPLGVAKGHYRLDVLASPSVVLQRFMFDKSMCERGAPPAGAVTIGLASTSEGVVSINNVKCKQDALIIFPARQEFESNSKSGFTCSTITIANELLAQLTEHHKIDIDVETLSTVEKVLAISAQDAYFIDGLLKEALFTEATEGVRHKRILENDLPLKLLSIFAGAKGIFPASRRRNIVLSRARKFIENNFSAPISVSDIYQFSNCNERMLQRVFNDYVGVSPVEYIRTIRLNSARKKIKTSGTELSITDIAYSCGFSHLGRFSDYYRQIYGEPPSETKRRRVI
ncbi:MAG: helix-turn-helix domain-containing protein [Halioglobus sp.]